VFETSVWFYHDIHNYLRHFSFSLKFYYYVVLSHKCENANVDDLTETFNILMKTCYTFNFVSIFIYLIFFNVTTVTCPKIAHFLIYETKK